MLLVVDGRLGQGQPLPAMRGVDRTSLAPLLNGPLSGAMPNMGNAGGHAMTPHGATAPPTKQEVELLFGRCLLQFQAFELLMKRIVESHRVSGSLSMPEGVPTRRINKTRRKTMGVLVGDMLGPVIVPAGREGLPGATEEASWLSFAFFLQIALPSEDYARIEAEHRALLKLRNSLIHHFLDEHNLRSEAGCLVYSATNWVRSARQSG